MYKYTFIKRAAISTDYENIRNNSNWHPRAWLSKGQNYINDDLLKTNETDGGFKRFLKGTGRVVNDLTLGTLKHMVGLADAPVRLGLGVKDMFTGDISGKELLGRTLDAGNDALWTGITLASGGTLGAAGKGLARTAKGLIPGSATNVSKQIANRVSQRMTPKIQQALASGNQQTIQNTLNQQLKYIDRFIKDPSLNQHYKAKILQNFKLPANGNLTKAQAQAMQSNIVRQSIKDHNLLHNADFGSFQKLLDAGKYSYADKMALSKARNGMIGQAQTATHSLINNPYVGTALNASLLGMVGNMVAPNKVFSALEAPGNFIFESFGKPAEWANKYRTSVSKDYVDNQLSSLGLNDEMKNYLFQKNIKDPSSYSLNTQALSAMAKSIAANKDSGMTEKDAYDYLYKSLMPYHSAKVSPWLTFDTIMQQGLAGESASQTSSSLAKRQELLNLLNS